MPVRGRGIDLDTLYFARASITAAVNTTATTSGTATLLLGTGQFSLEGPTTCLIEVFCASITKGTTNIDLELWEGSTTFIAALTGHLAADIAGQHLGRLVKLRSTGMAMLRVVSLFNKDLRGFLQVAPNYMKSVRYDANKLQRLLGPLKMTSYEAGIGQTLAWIASRA